MALLVASIAVIIFATLYFFSPLFDGLIMGVVFAYAAKPVKKKLSFLGNATSSFAATLVIVLPVSVLMFYGMFLGLNQAVYILTHYQQFVEEIVDLLNRLGVEADERYVRSLMDSFFSIIQSKLGVSAIQLTKSVILFILNFLVSAMVCFYSLADSERFIDRTLRIIPADRREEFRRFVMEIDETFESLWFGNFVVAMLIGLASLPYFLLFEIPFAPLLSALMFLAALIPIFAEWMIIVPVGLYVILQDVGRGLAFLGVGVVFLYILPELILRPHFLSYRTRIHPLLLMLAFVGGGLVGGVAGFFMAPMVVGLATAVYNYYTTVPEPLS